MHSADRYSIQDQKSNRYATTVLRNWNNENLEEKNHRPM